MLKGISLLVVLAIFSAPARAHIGDHGSYAVFAAVGHFFSEPIHVGAILAAMGLIVWFFSAKRRQKR